MGGQDTLRSYWRNYFEKTDALVWVVDATDRRRIDDCRAELAGLLLEEVSGPRSHATKFMLTGEEKRLMGASLLVFANKTDIDDCMSNAEIQQVRGSCCVLENRGLTISGASTGSHQNT